MHSSQKDGTRWDNSCQVVCAKRRFYLCLRSRLGRMAAQLLFYMQSKLKCVYHIHVACDDVSAGVRALL